nr:hypothetical protein [uncultured Desulfobulbus sp.]
MFAPRPPCIYDTTGVKGQTDKIYLINAKAESIVYGGKKHQTTPNTRAGMPLYPISAGDGSVNLKKVGTIEI